MTVLQLLQQTHSDQRTIDACFEQSREPDDCALEYLGPIELELISPTQLLLIARTIVRLD